MKLLDPTKETEEIVGEATSAVVEDYAMAATHWLGLRKDDARGEATAAIAGAIESEDQGVVESEEDDDEEDIAEDFDIETELEEADED